MKWPCWLAIAAAACGDNDAADYARSGTRLAVEWYAADDGTRVPTGTIHDHQLDDDCYPQDWSDGSRRCTESDGYVAYSDPGCTQPLVIGYSGTGTVAGQWNDATCSLARAFRIGGPIGAGMVYYRTANGCGTGFQADMRYSIGEELAPDTFVTLNRVELGDGRLHAIHYASADGLVWPRETFDTELAVTCSPGDSACQPNATSEGYYLDATCTQRVAATYTGCWAVTKYFAETDPCGTTTHVYRLGAVVTPTRLYSMAPSSRTCDTTTVDASAEYRAIGSEIEAAEMSRRYAVAPGHRLQVIYDAGSGVAASAGLFDAELGIPCTWSVATDGVTRCLPYYSSWSFWYSDAACTHEVRLLELVRTTGCPSQPPSAFTVNSVSDGQFEVRVVGARDNATVYSSAPGTCNPVTTTNQAFYFVGDLVAPESFVAATKTFD